VNPPFQVSKEASGRFGARKKRDADRPAHRISVARADGRAQSAKADFVPL
jgi:hypothetical protein